MRAIRVSLFLSAPRMPFRSFSFLVDRPLMIYHYIPLSFLVLAGKPNEIKPDDELGTGP